LLVGALAVVWLGGAADWLARAAPVLPAVLPPAHAVHLGLWFFTGSLFWLFRQHIRYYGWLALALLAAAWWLSGTGGRVALQVAVPYAVLWFAQVDLGQARNFGRHGDFSYGLYLYAFPVQQTIAHFGGARWPLPVYIAVCFALTLACAMASWRWIEAPALRLKHRDNAPQTRALHDPRQIGA
jgi:peptidoglycan/LPS O-acetylase OafA/YrhL